MAEYHDPQLRLLLWKYVKSLTHSPDDEQDLDAILTDDSIFSQTVNKYKNISTHYLASKMEIWFHLFMTPIYGVDAAVLAYEFAKSRGVIHYHTPVAMAYGS